MLWLANSYFQKMGTIIKMEMLSLGISVTGCTESCDFDNLWWNQWPKVHQNDDSVWNFMILEQNSYISEQNLAQQIYDYHNVCPTKEHPI